MNTLRPALVALAAAALVGPFASAGTLMQRPNRVTANPVTTTNKVLVAVPTDRLSESDYLYVVSRNNRDAHGIPVTVGGATPFNSTLVLMNAPLLEARDGFWGRNFLRAEPTGFQTFSLGSSAAEGNRNLGAEVKELREKLGQGIGVIASSGPRLSELPDRLQADPWALLNAGRHRDAGSVFAASARGAERDAGMALAAALLGRIDDAGTALGRIDPAALPETLPVNPDLAARTRNLAAGFYAGSPAGQVLAAIADASAARPGK